MQNPRQSRMIFDGFVWGADWLQILKGSGLVRALFVGMSVCFKILAFCVMAGLPARADAPISLQVQGAETELTGQLRDASLLYSVHKSGVTDPRELLASATADYARLLDTLYANGYYGGVINIRLNGREAALISILATPRVVNEISITVDPGPQFNFVTASVSPLAPNTDLPSGFKARSIARSSVIQEAVEAAALAWRNRGHAFVRVAQQDISANHKRQSLAALITLDPGALVRFGNLILTTESNVRLDRILAIAGLPTGETFSPEALALAAKRLRRSGAFSSVTLSEGGPVDGSDVMDISLALTDEKPNRFGIGAELSSQDGLGFSGYWIHRNLFGGAERLRIDTEITGIALDGHGIDYQLGLRLERPAVWGPNNVGYAFSKFEYLDEPAFQSNQIDFGVGISHIFTEKFSMDFGLEYSISKATDGLGTRRFSLLSLPVDAIWDRRDDPLNAKQGFYLRAAVTPFTELNSNAYGAHLFADGRAFRGFGQNDNVVLAARAQAGTVLTTDMGTTPPDFLFYSGGGNTVRGQPYQSLNVDLGGGAVTGGHSFFALSMEVRANISESFGIVGFGDIGYISEDSVFEGAGDWHSGAGLGLRYNTAFGPIRLDVAMPVTGDTGDGLQYYVGIGQSF